jgi:hypothetical protein
MKLITRKSECRTSIRINLVKSPKEAIRKTLERYLVKDGRIINIYQPSYVSREEIVLRNMNHCADISIRLVNNKPMATA